MKEFNLKQARAGKPVCTRDGRRARIVCFDRKNVTYPICALIEDRHGYDCIELFTLEGKHIYDTWHEESRLDLMMAPEKHTGWVNIATCESMERFVSSTIHPSEEAAKKEGERAPDHFITTVKIEWEE